MHSNDRMISCHSQSHNGLDFILLLCLQSKSKSAPSLVCATLRLILGQIYLLGSRCVFSGDTKFHQFGPMLKWMIRSRLIG